MNNYPAGPVSCERAYSAKYDAADALAGQQLRAHPPLWSPMPLPVLLPYRAHNGMFGVGLILVMAGREASCRPGEEITC